MLQTGTAALFSLAALIVAGASEAGEITVMSTVAVREPYLELVPAFERATENKVATIWVGVLTIPLISNEPINIGEKRLFEHELAEFFHERPQSRLLHGWNELIMHAALTEQGMCSPLGGAGFEMFVESESFASGAEQRQKSRRQSIEQPQTIAPFGRVDADLSHAHAKVRILGIAEAAFYAPTFGIFL